jgi:hypothetical protein
VFENMMRAGYAFQNPALMFETAFDFAAVGEHRATRQSGLIALRAGKALLNLKS